MSDAERIALAQEFLQEAVYRSRAAQAATTALRKAQSTTSAGNCGLGEKAAIELDLGERGRELFERLWGADGTGGAGGADGAGDGCALDVLRTRMAEWIQAQDALDRKLNHYLKDFRGRHGFDRTRYDTATLAAYEDGLAELHREQDRRRMQAARAILEA